MSGPNTGPPIPADFLKDQMSFSRNPQDTKNKIPLNSNTDDNEVDAAEMAKDTGLLWIYDGASPMEKKQDNFTFQAKMSSSQAQFSTSQTDDYKDLEHSMSNLSVNEQTKTPNFSSNSLQGYNNIPNLQMQPPRYHGASSQVVNSIPPLEEVNYESR